MVRKDKEQKEAKNRKGRGGKEKQERRGVEEGTRKASLRCWTEFLFVIKLEDI